MVGRRAVEGRGDDFALHGTFHIRDLFRTFVHEHDHEMDFRVVHGNRVRDGLHDHRLARLGRGHDQAALALADGRDQVDDPPGHVGRRRLEAEPLLRVQGGQLVELGASLRLLGVGAVDRLDADERVVLLPLPLALGAHHAGDDVALAEAPLLDHRQ